MANMKRITNEVQLNFRLTKDQREELRRKSWEQNKSVSMLVREALLQHNYISPTVK
jgi:hypothetical protein